MAPNAAKPLAPIIEDSDVLAGVRGFSDQVEDAELGIITGALEWAHRNPGEVLAAHSDAWWHKSMAELIKWELLSREAMPLVDDMSIPEFAYAARISHRAARSLIRDALVLFYRFPRTWAHLANGHVPTWRARLVAQKGRGLPFAAATFVDAAITHPGMRFTGPQVQKVVDEARLRYLPEEVEAEREQNAEGRTVEIDTSSAAHLGLSDLTGCLDLPDALDLEAALAHGAARLKQLGSTEPLKVRRAHALGDLARSAQGKPSVFDGEERPAWDGTGVPETGVKLYIHLNHTALRCRCEDPSSREHGVESESLLEKYAPEAPPHPVFDNWGTTHPVRGDHDLGEVARVEGTGMPTALLSPDVIRSWLTRTTVSPDQRPTIVVRRVIDTEEYAQTDAYEIPDRLRESTRLKDGCCVFPYCHSPARNCDADHITPFSRGGPTCTCNLAPLCRFHHRVKTHGQEHDDHKWTYAPLGGGEYLWQGPNSIRLLRGPRGTEVLADDVFASRPHDAGPTPGVRQIDGSHSAVTEDHPAYENVSDPGFLPRSDSGGAPAGHQKFYLIKKLLEQRAKTPLHKGEYVQFAARGGDAVKRPTIQIIKDAGIYARIEANGTASYTDVVISSGPPPF